MLIINLALVLLDEIVWNDEKGHLFLYSSLYLEYIIYKYTLILELNH